MKPNWTTVKNMGDVNWNRAFIAAVGGYCAGGKAPGTAVLLAAKLADMASSMGPVNGHCAAQSYSYTGETTAAIYIGSKPGLYGPDQGIGLMQAMVHLGLADTICDARVSIEAGCVFLNYERVVDDVYLPSGKRYAIGVAGELEANVRLSLEKGEQIETIVTEERRPDMLLAQAVKQQSTLPSGTHVLPHASTVSTAAIG